MTRPRLEIDGLGKRFGDTVVLNGISLTLGAGEIVSVLGPSGSGKSTILSILTGGLAADSGEIRVDGAPRGHGPSPFAFMPQNDVLLAWRRIIDNAALGLEVQGLSRRQAREQVGRQFRTFGLAGTERMYPRQLSGGMRQRVALLRTIAQARDVLLLDEPFGALDAITRDELQQWLLGMWQANRWSVVLITHDIREALRLSDRVYVLSAKPARVVAEVAVSRAIPRDDGFLLNPRVPPLEAELHAALAAGAAAPLRR